MSIYRLFVENAGLWMILNIIFISSLVLTVVAYLIFACSFPMTITINGILKI